MEINDFCINCGECRRVCPIVDAVYFAGDKYRINNDACVYCGDCRDVCPCDAITENPSKRII